MVRLFLFRIWWSLSVFPLAAATDGSAAQVGWRRIPDPTDPANQAACHISQPAMVCDLDGALGEHGVVAIASLLHDAHTRIRMDGCGGDGARDDVAPAAAIAVAVIQRAASGDAAGFSETDAVSGARAVLDAWRVAASAECRNGVSIVLAIDEVRASSEARGFRSIGKGPPPLDLSAPLRHRSS